MPNTPKPSSNGFTLIELSIVLVIIGLIVGGVLVGQDLIKSAEMRSIISSVTSYKTAANTFRLKYNGLPGDLKNATTFWSAAGSCPGTPGTISQTCNGDGDKSIDGGGGGDDYNERFMFFQHLGLAGMIEGVYTGVSGPLSSADTLIGTNSPELKRKGVTVLPYNYPTPFSGHGTFFDGYYGNMIYLAKDYSTGTGSASAPAFTPLESYNMDTKIDDGRPGLGKVTVRWNACTDAGSAADFATAVYDLTHTGECWFAIRKIW